MLEEIHPIEDTPLCVAFPWLGCFTMCGTYPKYRSDQVSEAHFEHHSLDADNTEPMLQKKKTIVVNGKEIAKKAKKKKKN